MISILVRFKGEMGGLEGGLPEPCNLVDTYWVVPGLNWTVIPGTQYLVLGKALEKPEYWHTPFSIPVVCKQGAINTIEDTNSISP